jgi:hypothetical protein
MVCDPERDEFNQDCQGTNKALSKMNPNAIRRCGLISVVDDHNPKQEEEQKAFRAVPTTFSEEVLLASETDTSRVIDVPFVDNGIENLPVDEIRAQMKKVTVNTNKKIGARMETILAAQARGN